MASAHSTVTATATATPGTPWTPWFCVKSILLAPDPQKKVFLNICTQPAVPKPPQLPGDVLQDRLDSASESLPYLIPLALSEPREDVDKGAAKANPSNANPSGSLY
jgi:hypothetical protein